MRFLEDATLERLADALVAACPPLDATGRALALAIYRGLAEGRPVPVARLARDVGTSERWVQTALEDWCGVFRDDLGRIIGFWGLALTEMAHRLTVVDRTVYAWCAWDPLFIGPLLGRSITVESACPVTGDPIALTVTPDGVCDAQPSTTVLSFLALDGTCGDDVITTFCHYVLFFASEQAARTWTAEHDDTFPMTLDEGFELGRRIRERLYFPSA